MLNTDLNTHTKRFLGLVLVSLAVLVLAITVELFIIAAQGNFLFRHDEFPDVKREYSDLAQIHDLASLPSSVAIQKVPLPSAPAEITIAMGPLTTTPTPTVSDVITLETLAVDVGKRKKGDFLYHIPIDSARRIHDYLAMIGFADLVDACKGYDLFDPNTTNHLRRDTGTGRGPDTIEGCRRRVEAFVPSLMEGAPHNAIQLAQRNYPPQPGRGQPVQYPVENVMVGGEYMAVHAYRAVRAQRRRQVPGPPQPQFLVPEFVKAVLGLTIVIAAVMEWGQALTEIWVHQTAVKLDLNERFFNCPDGILCSDGGCAAQDDITNIPLRQAWCVEVRFYVIPENCFATDSAYRTCTRIVHATLSDTFTIQRSSVVTWTPNMSGLKS
jgi:hypothetical protein